MKHAFILLILSFLTIIAQAGDADLLRLSLSDHKPEIGVAVTYSFTLPDSCNAQSLEVEVGENPKNQIILSKVPSSNNQLNWSGELILLTDSLKELKSFQINASTDSGDSITLYTEPMPIVVGEPSVEETTPDDYTLPDEPEVEWERLITATIAVTTVLGGSALALILLLRRVISNNAKRKLANQKSSETPLQYFQKESECLITKKILNGIGLSAHYTYFSYLLRKYIEETTNIRALEMTDDELTKILSSQKVPSGFSNLSVVFENTGLAKYSRSTFNDQIIEEDIALLKEFIESQELEAFANSGGSTQ